MRRHNFAYQKSPADFKDITNSLVCNCIAVMIRFKAFGSNVKSHYESKLGGDHLALKLEEANRTPSNQPSRFQKSH